MNQLRERDAAAGLSGGRGRIWSLFCSPTQGNTEPQHNTTRPCSSRTLLFFLPRRLLRRGLEIPICVYKRAILRVACALARACVRVCVRLCVFEKYLARRAKSQVLRFGNHILHISCNRKQIGAVSPRGLTKPGAEQMLIFIHLFIFFKRKVLPRALPPFRCRRNVQRSARRSHQAGACGFFFTAAKSRNAGNAGAQIKTTAALRRLNCRPDCVCRALTVRNCAK